MLGDTPLLFEVDGDHDNVSSSTTTRTTTGSMTLLLTTAASSINLYRAGGDRGQSLGNKKLLTHARCADAFQDTNFFVEAKVVRFDQDSWQTACCSSKEAEAPCFSECVQQDDKNRCYPGLRGAGGFLPQTHSGCSLPPVVEAVVEDKHREEIEGKANIKLSAECRVGNRIQLKL